MLQQFIFVFRIPDTLLAFELDVQLGRSITINEKDDMVAILASGVHRNKLVVNHIFERKSNSAHFTKVTKKRCISKPVSESIVIFAKCKPLGFKEIIDLSY